MYANLIFLDVVTEQSDVRPVSFSLTRLFSLIDCFHTLHSTVLCRSHTQESGQHLSKESLQGLLRSMDLNKNGQIDMAEFLHVSYN